MKINGRGSSIGYRLMHQRIRNDYWLTVNRETVRLTLKKINPEGVERRSRRRFERRKYYSKGSNYIWHVDGYDKLKPFVFCIHGAIDGYSRRILWLEASFTNNDPRVIAEYYCDCIKQVGGAPRIVRTDESTENCSVAGIQCFFRRKSTDSFAGDKSFMYGRSVANQRIEAWWSFLRKTDSDWWIKLFKDIRDVGIYCNSNPVHVECLKFCFIKLIQDELKHVAQQWNLHRIRQCRNSDSLAGRPDVLLFLPELEETMDYATPVPSDEIDLAKEICCDHVIELPASREFVVLAHPIMEEEYLTMPDDAARRSSELINRSGFSY